MIKQLIEIICFAVFFAELSQVPQNIMYYLCKANLVYKIDIYNTHKPRRIKPFDCAMCLASWIGFVYQLLNFTNVFHLMAFCSMCSVGAVLLISILNKLKSLNL